MAVWSCLAGWEGEWAGRGMVGSIEDLGGPRPVALSARELSKGFSQGRADGGMEGEWVDDI